MTFVPCDPCEYAMGNRVKGVIKHISEICDNKYVLNHIFSLAEMASRYIARRYGEQTGNRSRASSVVSESTSRASSQVK